VSIFDFSQLRFFEMFMILLESLIVLVSFMTFLVQVRLRLDDIRH
jgi:hypothetical protein